MWAQEITVRLRPGVDPSAMAEHLRSIEQPGSGMLRTLLMRDQRDPDRLHILVVFESEEKARERERDPRRTEGLVALRKIMADLFAEPPAFVDLLVAEEWTGA